MRTNRRVDCAGDRVPMAVLASNTDGDSKGKHASGGAIGDTTGNRCKRGVPATGFDGNATHRADCRKPDRAAANGSAGRAARGNSIGDGAVGYPIGNRFK